nr:hypothetical protein [Pandoravirus aubagnensis]
MFMILKDSCHRWRHANPPFPMRRPECFVSFMHFGHSYSCPMLPFFVADATIFVAVVHAWACVACFSFFHLMRALRQCQGKKDMLPKKSHHTFFLPPPTRKAPKMRQA